MHRAFTVAEFENLNLHLPLAVTASNDVLQAFQSLLWVLKVENQSRANVLTRGERIMPYQALKSGL